MPAREMIVKVHSVAEEGLPNASDFVGRMALIFDGCIVSGWPIAEEFMKPGDLETYGPLWEGDSDVSHNRPFAKVTHWIEFPEPAWDTEKEGK